jgi:error-prone DNA polymerase
LLVVRQHPPTAKGFAFLAVEDSGGMINVVIAPDVYARDRAALQGVLVLIEGVLQKQHTATPHCAHAVGASVHVLARQLSAL